MRLINLLCQNWSFSPPNHTDFTDNSNISLLFYKELYWKKRKNRAARKPIWKNLAHSRLVDVGTLAKQFVTL
jgi:hypothetical protein